MDALEEDALYISFHMKVLSPGEFPNASYETVSDEDYVLSLSVNTIMKEGIQIDCATSEVRFSLASRLRITERFRCLTRLVLLFFSV